MKRIMGLDFARTLSAIGIIAFHFYCHSASEVLLFWAHTNGTWGDTLNYLFFALSGLVVHLRYKDSEDIRVGQFYYKRWKATLPAYVLVWMFAYFLNVTLYGKFFYIDIPKIRMLLTFIGMDGYAAWIAQTYLITGEWFLGAVLIAYLCYPILNRMIKKPVLSTALLFLVYEIRLHAGYLGIEQFFALDASVAPSTCLFCFFVGMLLAEHFELLKNPLVVVLSCLCFIGGLCVPIEGHRIAKEFVIGCALLVCLYNTGELLCKKSKVINKAVASLSSLTYYIFLLHHSIIYRVLDKFNPENTLRAFTVLCSITLLSFIFARILSIVMKSFMESKIMRYLDSIVLGKG